MYKCVLLNECRTVIDSKRWHFMECQLHNPKHDILQSMDPRTPKRDMRRLKVCPEVLWARAGPC